MKIWLIVALLAVATSVAVAAVAAEADSTKTAAKVIEAETDLPPTSTDVAGDDEGSETTESASATLAEDENNEKKKMKGEKSEPIKEGEQEEGEEEEEEGENEEENEESEEGDSDEDSEEEESKGKERKKTKIESEEEGDQHKEDAYGKIKFPTRQQPPAAEVPTRSRTFVTPAAASPITQPDLHKTREPKWFFNSPNSKSIDVPAKVESPKFDSTETSTRAAVHHQVWSSSARPVAKSVETRPATTRPTDVTPSDTRKPHHPKWFFNTAKEKSSADGSTKIESPKPTAIFEIPTRKAAAAISMPTWPSITTAKPASPVASHEPADFSHHSDNHRSHSHWYFNTPTKPSDGFAKKESNTKPAAIEIPTRNGRPAGSSHHATHPWTPSGSRPVLAPVPVYKPVEVTPPPPRKQYPRWFFNIKS